MDLNIKALEQYDIIIRAHTLRFIRKIAADTGWDLNTIKEICMKDYEFIDLNEKK